MEADGPFLVRLHEAILLDGSHGYEAGKKLEASAKLEAGFHPIRIYFLEDRLRKSSTSSARPTLRVGQTTRRPSH
ncbi:MAG: hypothetical protein R2724_20190 [Bryobacterales bacterium]